jgi:hypothetical protein
VLLILFGEIGIALILWILEDAMKLDPQHYSITKIDDRGEDIGNYLVAYLLPFLVLPDPTPTDLTAYAGFLLIAGVIYVRSDLIHINPMLSLLGFRVARIETSEGYFGILITRRRYSGGELISAARIRNSVLVEL